MSSTTGISGIEKPRRLYPRGTRVRIWHGYLGLVLSPFVLALCVSGVILNHHAYFAPAIAPTDGGESQSLSIATARDLHVTLSAAAKTAQKKLGDVALDKVEVEVKAGRIAYVFKTDEADGGREIIIDATTGKASKKDKSRQINGAYRWDKIAKDVHTAKLFKTISVPALDVISGLVALLTLTGVYLWITSLRWFRRG